MGETTQMGCQIPHSSPITTPEKGMADQDELHRSEDGSPTLRLLKILPIVNCEQWQEEQAVDARNELIQYGAYQLQ